jgi:hypothetical protein
MKQTATLIVAIALIACLPACNHESSQQSGSGTGSSSSSSAGRITTEKAQQALNQWIARAGSGQVTIVGGVREVSAENAATAELKFTNFVYQSSQTKETRNYSGPGNATFVHYTDGRWVLNKVLAGDVWASTTWSPNIEVR